MLHTEGSDKLLIAWLITVLAQDVQRSLTLVKSLSTLAQTTAQAIGNKSLLENLLNGGIDIHRSERSRSGAAATTSPSTSDMLSSLMSYLLVK